MHHHISLWSHKHAPDSTDLSLSINSYIIHHRCITVSAGRITGATGRIYQFLLVHHRQSLTAIISHTSTHTHTRDALRPPFEYGRRLVIILPHNKINQDTEHKELKWDKSVKGEQINKGSRKRQLEQNKRKGTAEYSIENVIWRHKDFAQFSGR